MVVLIVVLLIALAIIIHTGRFQSWLKNEAKEYLTQTLHTNLDIDSVGFDVFNGDICLFGLYVDDLQKRRMLEMDALEVHSDLLPLLEHRVCISSIDIKGIKANLFKERRDTAANYQFILDAFKKERKKKPSEESSQKKEEKKLIVLNLDNFNMSDVDIRFNDKRFKLERLDTKNLEYQGEKPLDDILKGKLKVDLKGFETSWTSRTKKGPVKNFLRIDKITNKKASVQVKGLHFSNDNSLPRKNTGKPKRGWFDAGHVDAVVDIDLTIHHIGKDSTVITVDRCVAKDTTAGFDARDIHLKAKVIGKEVHLSNIAVQQISTTINIDTAYLRLPNKAAGDTTMYYSTSMIKGRTLLRDISRPFGPVLSRFSIPLNLRARMSGDAEGMRFSDISVFTDDKALTVAASGFITGLKNKYKLNVHFDVKRMTARVGIAEKIINQFVVKKFMMKQLNRLGTIGYTGSFDVLWKKEQFRGLLSTKAGGINFFFQLDELTKYVSGTTSSKNLNLGYVMDMPDIGPVTAKANFRFDISKPRTAAMRRKKGGKLPIGHVDALVDCASYKFVKVTNVRVNIDSDGAIANGNVQRPGKLADLSCDFSFTNTDAMQKTKIKPRMKLHLGGKKMTDEEKAQAKAEKEKQKAEKKAAKEQRKAEKARLKQEKAAAKAKQKAEKAAAKAQQKSEGAN